MAPGARVDWQSPALKQWINGCPCCAKLWNGTTSGWTRFWLRWNQARRGKNGEHDDQDESQDRRRYSYRGDPALRRASRSRVPRAYRPETDPEMAARPRRLDDARLHQRSPAGWKVPLRMDQGRSRIPGDGRVHRIAAV